MTPKQPIESGETATLPPAGLSGSANAGAAIAGAAIAAAMRLRKSPWPAAESIWGEARARNLNA